MLQSRSRNADVILILIKYNLDEEYWKKLTIKKTLLRKKLLKFDLKVYTRKALR